jgi:hypothetical protein
MPGASGGLTNVGHRAMRRFAESVSPKFIILGLPPGGRRQYVPGMARLTEEQAAAVHAWPWRSAGYLYRLRERMTQV